MLSDPIGSLRELVGMLGQHPILLIVVVLVSAFSLIQFGSPSTGGRGDS